MLWVLIGFVQLVVGVIAAYFFLVATVFLEATLAAPTLASAVALASIIWLIGLLASFLFGVARPALFGLVFTFIGTAIGYAIAFSGVLDTDVNVGPSVNFSFNYGPVVPVILGLVGYWSHR